MEKREGIMYIIEQNRIREIEDMGDLPHSYSGWNADGIRVYIHDSELSSILPAVRILMPELTKKNYSWLLITGVMIGSIVFLVVFLMVISSIFSGDKVATPPPVVPAGVPVIVGTGGVLPDRPTNIVQVEQTQTGASVDDEYIVEKKANYALFDANMSKDMLQVEYDRLHNMLDLAKGDLDKCTVDLTAEKAKIVDPNDVRAGKALRAYCSDITRSEDEKIICGKLFFNFIKNGN